MGKGSCFGIHLAAPLDPLHACIVLTGSMIYRHRNTDDIVRGPMSVVGKNRLRSRDPIPSRTMVTIVCTSYGSLHLDDTSLPFQIMTVYAIGEGVLLWNSLCCSLGPITCARCLYRSDGHISSWEHGQSCQRPWTYGPRRKTDVTLSYRGIYEFHAVWELIR